MGRECLGVETRPGIAVPGSSTRRLTKRIQFEGELLIIIIKANHAPLRRW